MLSRIQPTIATRQADMLALGLHVDRMLSVKSGKHLRPNANGAANRTEQNTFMERGETQASLRPAECDSAGMKSSWHVSLVGSLI